MKKRLLSAALALVLVLSLAPAGRAANVPNDVNYYELNPYTNAQLLDEDADGAYHFAVTIPADGSVQCCPLFLNHIYAYVEISDENVVSFTTNGYGIHAYAGKAPGTATVKFRLSTSQSSQYDYKAVIDVTVLSPEDFAVYTGSDATRSAKGHTHTITVAETPNPANNELLRREVCTECGYWCNLSPEPLSGGGNSTGTGSGNNSTGDTGTGSSNTGAGTTVTTANVIPGVNSPSALNKTPILAPTRTSNINAQNYPYYASDTVKSYLYENPSGGLTRVECTDNKVLVEDYDSSLQFLSGFSIPMELPIWGGFYAGKSYNYMVFGQKNDAENDSAEVIRVVKYAKDWSQRLGYVSLCGANTTEPFRSSCVRFAEEGDFLYIRTAHTMYTSSDGLRHQASLMLSVQESDMSIVNAFYAVSNSSVGYVSHSFNQFILTDQRGNVVFLDHGDAYPRAAILMRADQLGGGSEPGAWWGNKVSSVELVSFPGATGANQTGCAVGGFAETSNGYVAAYSYDGVGGSGSSRDVYLSFATSGLSASSVKVSSGVDASAPQLASTGLNGGYVLWTQRTGAKMGGSLYYADYDANGRASAVKTASGALSDCAPIQYNGKTVWYVTDNSAPTFYSLDASGVTSRSMAADDPTTVAPAAPGSTAVYDSVAYANTQTVLLDGKPVTFETYALHDQNGGVVNFIKLRDMAYYMKGTQAEFSIGWEPGVITMLTEGAYVPNGSELSTPFSGNRSYRTNTGRVIIDAMLRNVEAIVLTDDKGGDYTYFKLRDLGQYLGFNVSFINKQVVVNSNEPYSDAQ